MKKEKINDLKDVVVMLEKIDSNYENLMSKISVDFVADNYNYIEDYDLYNQFYDHADGYSCYDYDKGEWLSENSDTFDDYVDECGYENDCGIITMIERAIQWEDEQKLFCDETLIIKSCFIKRLIEEIDLYTDDEVKINDEVLELIDTNIDIIDDRNYVVDYINEILEEMGVA